MASLGNSAVLLDYDSDASAATEQTRLVALSNIIDNTPEDAVFNLGLYVSQTGGATSPACTLSVQASHDNTSFFPMVQLRVDGTDSEEFAWTEVNLPRYLRIKVSPSGGTKPAVEARVMLAGSIGFTATVTTPS